ncbi:unnamed protein product [Allacma fusca]|uniref:Aldehyde oxidase/xanthine dehydrogenase second molybdopterin binding domain-containing protein n=1 Tax=Allacma fusca TaxID=39272 RepID=A0A8J2KY47_9HEXA|nr:unnamed protein product [Allacma fusca]
METVMDHIAFVLKKDPLEIRMTNLLKEGDALYPDTSNKFEGENMIPRMLEELKATADIEDRQKFIDSFNNVIYVFHATENIVYTYGCLIWATTENVCHSAAKASEILIERMKPVKEKLGSPTWQQLTAECKKLGMDLNSNYVTTYADQLKPYGVWGICASEVEIDCLTGEYRIIRVDLMSDAGMSLSPDVDIGQTEGSFVMGLGWLLSEKIIHDENTGELLTNRTWNYKPPTAKDLPEDFRVSLLKNAPNTLGVLRSKSLAEAPFVLSLSVFAAMRKAIFAARVDAGNNDWFQMDGPLTPEDIQRYCLTDVSQFTL